MNEYTSLYIFNNTQVIILGVETLSCHFAGKKRAGKKQGTTRPVFNSP